VAYTEFYCDASTGSNINAGDGQSVVTSTNGGWNSGTGVFTAASGTPFSGVSVGQFASVYTDGATTTGFVGRVTAVGGGGSSLTISTTVKMGTAPTTAGSGISCTTGGVWKGPNGTEGWPLTTDISALVNTSNNPPRVNLKNTATYSITAAMTVATNGNRTYQGYATTVGDGGKAIIDGGTSGASYQLLTVTAVFTSFIDLIFQNNGATGSASGVGATVSRVKFVRCVVHDVRGNGFDFTSNATDTQQIECEAYLCNASNTAGKAGFGTAGFLMNCISHDNAGSNTAGFITNLMSNFVNCIADSNGGRGFSITSAANCSIANCDSYNNAGDGFALITNDVEASIFNSNAVKNGGYGFNFAGTRKTGYLWNCAVGAGTQANTSGGVNDGAGNNAHLSNVGQVTYANDATPWNDPASGDFRITLAAAKNAGRGAFTQTQASYTGTVEYPDIGAAQHIDSGSGGVPAMVPLVYEGQEGMLAI